MISALWLIPLVPLSLMGLWLAIAISINWRWVMAYLLNEKEGKK